MPTVENVDGLRVVIYPNDHRPAHVHVMGRGCEAIYKLNCPDGPPDLRENYGFSPSALAKIKTAVALKLSHLCGEWRTIHGEP